MGDFKLQFMNFCSASQRVGKIVHACDHFARSRAPWVNRAILCAYLFSRKCVRNLRLRVPGTHGTNEYSKTVVAKYYSIVKDSNADLTFGN